MTLTPDLTEKQNRLLSLLAGYGDVVVAYSGGVDSAVVAYAARHACGERAVAVTAVSQSLASGELEAAVELANRIGIRHEVLQTSELERSDYRKNAPDRCFHCKTELYTRLEEWLPDRFDGVIVNGANLDDHGDHRPGMQAARRHSVRSPMIDAGLTKADVRALAKAWDLPVWDKPATPCLSSRIAYGVEVTPERLARVDRAESFLRETLNLNELRVRHEANDLARIELPIGSLDQLTKPAVREQVLHELEQLGFRYVTLDLAGFRSGSMNAVIPVEQLTRTMPPAESK